jgi:hypothetical protein
MDQGFAVVIGMSIAYFFSFLGLLLAYYSFKKKQRDKGD